MKLLWLALGASLVASLVPSACRAELADCNAAEPSRVLRADAGESAAAAYWLAPRQLHWPGVAAEAGTTFSLHAGRERVALRPGGALVPGWIGEGARLELPAAALPRVKAMLRAPLALVQADAAGRELQRTGVQAAAVLDAVYGAAQRIGDLGVTRDGRRTRFKLWAPTATRVEVCVYPRGGGTAARVAALRRDEATGAWSTSLPGPLSGGTYTYLVDVVARGSGLVRNRVTDPYSASLTTDSQRSWIGHLDDPALAPPGWAADRAPARLQHGTDAVIYELHVRDFSAADASVPAAHRGKYLAFTHAGSRGMQHLRALAKAGVTDVHLLPVFDFATVPESGCVTPRPAGPPDGDAQQAAVAATAATDCFNWGYDPWHYTAPEGSYATDAADGAVRIFEFRRMVMALHRAGLRVGMDMVYNHTTASGQKARSVLDRIVPGYYQRLDAQGRVETSTCCDNTATEHAMMAKLMIDSAVTWARHHHIDGMRFDLMGHQPRDAMLALQRAVDAATGRHVQLLGEGWDFGEVAADKRFVQAAQGRLDGTGIGTFSDRGRDAVRGGGCCDDAAATLSRQGWITGLVYDPNPRAGATRDELLRTADLVRAGLAGTLRGYRMTTHDGSVKALSEIAYTPDKAAGYASQPDEVVNYVENHDNPTLFDIGVLKLPPGTSREDRARVQLLGLAVTAFSQGVAYFHAGSELLRSKSLDRNSFDSGDWFNPLDFTFTDNGFGRGLPPKAENGTLWPAMKPLLADAAVKPRPEDIAFVRDAFFDLLRIRAGNGMFRLRSADEIARRLVFFNTGPQQEPTVIVGHLDGAGTGFPSLLYAINVDKASHALALPALQGRAYALHPAHRADARVRESRWDENNATLTVPPRTAVVFVAD